ncbi:T9SS type B sorting domain-containing protein [Hanstruepera ponticola]|uniref:T9SS type B sorting domain-containing protein n=1 Tax=Hanstruepera ponticola TaxID=2042995 RepID=UPI000CF0FA66|nr:choice-of-anchor L domain-containing protein [Hanstruepera ponticola]
MKNYWFLLALITSLVSWSQNVLVDAQTYSPQQLIEDILVDSNCITNVNVTNVVGGDFGGSDLSYGYFDASGSSFPFQSGVVLSTGRLNNVQGPNTSLSDDDAPNWVGDNDLESVLQDSNTLNATIIEFDFEAVANQISFRYIFASEEYQEGNNNTCQYSDLFGFLIRPSGTTQYENIAIVPGTDTPIKVTTVHSGIPGSGGCDPINEAYFGSWNDSSAPINFNGQTTVLTAVADVIPDATYHVKLVIADHVNYRYDSAVFLEAGSFQLTSDLGPDRLIANYNALCPDETLELDATQANADNYTWFQNGVELAAETNATFEVDQPGSYEVEVTINGTCIAYGAIEIEYASDPIVFDTTLVACDIDFDGFTTYNLWNTVADITDNDPNLSIVDFFETQAGAEGSDAGLIANPSSYDNTSIGQTVYARVVNRNGCISVAEVILDIANNPVSLDTFPACDDNNDGITVFSIVDLENHILSNPDVPNTANITFYASEADLINQSNPIINGYENLNNPYSDELFVQISNNNNCFAYTTLQVVVFDSPEIALDESAIYCLNEYPQTITLEAGTSNQNNLTYQWFLNGTDLQITSENIQINEVGTYTVVATNPNNCSISRDILVNPSNIATIENIEVNDGVENNTITVSVSGEGDYEYALDNGVYQDEPFFDNVLADTHVLLIRDKNGCGVITEEVAVFGFPKFFTPNGDGINDTWNPKGISAKTIAVRIKIFDRYGKLLKEINASDSSWDGTFNGKPQITDDYWYQAVLPNGKTFNGHFTLKR